MQAAHQYSIEVELIINSKCVNNSHIERVLDGMLDFCFDESMLALYKKLCRYYFPINPAAVKDYVYAYRDLWDNEMKNGEL